MVKDNHLDDEVVVIDKKDEWRVVEFLNWYKPVVEGIHLNQYRMGDRMPMVIRYSVGGDLCKECNVFLDKELAIQECNKRNEYEKEIKNEGDYRDWETHNTL